MNIATTKDISNLVTYCKHFNLKIPDKLSAIIKDTLESDNLSKENSELIAAHVYTWITSDDHFLNDPLWQSVITKAKEHFKK